MDGSSGRPASAPQPPGAAADDAGPYGGLFERLPVGVYRSAPDGRLLDANPALVALAGWPSREALLRTPLDEIWVHPHERQRWQALMERDGVVRDFEFLHRRHDGGTLWVRETARAVRDGDGNLLFYEGVVEDVTQRRQAEDRVRFQAEVLAGLRESVSATDLNGNLVYWNDASTELFGATAEQALGQSVLDICVAPSLRENAAAIIRDIPQGKRYFGEFQGRRRGREDVCILLSVSPMRDEHGNIVGSVGIASDLTQQKREEEAQRFLAESTAVLAASLDYEETLRRVCRLAVPTLADWCFVDVVEDDGGIRRVATAHVDAGKETLAEALLRHRPDPDGAGVTQRVIRTGRTWWTAEVEDAALAQLSHHPDHLPVLREMEVLSAMAVPLIARGRTLGVLRVCTRRGGRRYAEADVRLAEELARRVALALDNARLYREAQAAVEAREQVLRVVSHDLRNPLSSVVAHSELLMEAADAPESAVREWAGTIRAAAGQMTRIIRDLLDASNLQSGRLSIEPAACAAHPLLAEAVQVLRPIAARRDQRLHYQVAGDLPAVQADPERVLQVLSNLICNAVKFTPRGGEIVVRARPADGGVAFTVADSGPGLGDDELERVFEPFWRGRLASRDGLGLGLAIARGLVEAHGGMLTAANGAEGGAVFEFTLPPAPAQPGAAAAAA